MIAIFLLLPSLAPAESNQTPPPLPTPEARARFIAAEQQAALFNPELIFPRTIHDEYNVLHYDISLGLDIPNHILTGTVGVEAVAEIDDLSQIEIDLFDCMTVDAVTAGGSPALFTHTNNLLTITLDGMYQPEESFYISCTYHGTPLFPGNALPFRWLYQYNVPMILSYSEPYGAPAWWMCKDDPKDKATFTIDLTVPDTLTAVSNGLLTSTDDNGDGTITFHWNTDYPMPTYLFSIAVTNFESWTETYTALDGVTTMDVDYYAFPSDLAKAMESWNKNIEMMEFYAGLFGEYPFLSEKYGIAEFSHPGAMEHQTCTSMGAYWVNGYHNNDFVVAHELSHSWVGDMITMTEWSHAWCKEGFATYCEALYFEALYGVEYYHFYMENMDVFNYAGYQLYNITPPLHGAIYYKGAWVLHMLRHIIGDTAFFDAVYAYTNNADFRYDVADTDDLRGVFEAASGMDLEWYFDQWIYNPGYPEYDAFWTMTEARDGWDVILDVTQTQTTGPIFKMPVDIVVTTDLGSETFVVWDSLQVQSFTLHVNEQPTRVQFDPEDWVLRQITLTSDVPEIVSFPALRLIPNQPNPFGETTWIGFQLEHPAQVILDIYDSRGRWINRLMDDRQPAGQGRIRWNGTDAAGREVSSGIYYTKLRAGAEKTSRSLVVIR